MATLPEHSIDAIVTDPPYELGVLGKRTAWDSTGVANDVRTWQEAARVLKPGGYLVAFSSARTYHRMTTAIEDANFEIRDQLLWLYGSGFPKSLNISASLDQQRHDRPQVLQVTRWIKETRESAGVTNKQIDQAFGFNNMAGHWTTQAQQPEIPTLEQIPKLLALLGDPVVPPEIHKLIYDLNGIKGERGENWYKREITGQHSTSAAIQRWKANYRDHTANEAQARRDIPTSAEAIKWDGWGTTLKPAHEPITLARNYFPGTLPDNIRANGIGALNIEATRVGDTGTKWPANLLLTDETAALIDQEATTDDPPSKFFYSGKTSLDEREAGMDGFDASAATGRRKNHHPTVKPIELMRYLIRLVVPPGGTVLDPFSGSGSTGLAALDEGAKYIGIDLDPEYNEIARARIEHRHLLGDLSIVEPSERQDQGRLF